MSQDYSSFAVSSFEILVDLEEQIVELADHAISDVQLIMSAHDGLSTIAAGAQELQLDTIYRLAHRMCDALRKLAECSDKQTVRITDALLLTYDKLHMLIINVDDANSFDIGFYLQALQRVSVIEPRHRVSAHSVLTLDPRDTDVVA